MLLTWLQEWTRLPASTPGQKIGLFGGSFNPPHLGHLRVAETATKKLQLDAIWWLVSPGNPLKSKTDLLPLSKRISSCVELTTNPVQKITAYEAGINTNFTATTVKNIRLHRPFNFFVWIMGADNLNSFHRWENWQYIIESIPVAVISRPEFLHAATRSVAGNKFAASRINECDANQLVYMRAPRWVFLQQQLDPSSSTTLRENKISGSGS